MLPKDGQLVKLSILDEHVILGAFKEIDAKGRVVLYCLLDEDGACAIPCMKQSGTR